MIDFLEGIGLHPKNWQNWVHCGLDEWLVDLMLQGGTTTMAFYMLFSALLVLGIKWKVGNRLFVKWWWRWMILVFVQCGLVHFGHVYAKINPVWYSISLLYPTLNISMLGVLVTTVISIKKKWMTLKTEEESNKEKTQLADIILHELSSSSDVDVAIQLMTVKKKLIAQGFDEQSKLVSELMNSLDK